MHNCPDCGLAHDGPEPAAAPVVVEAPAAGPNDNDVRIAEVQAAAEIELAQIRAEEVPEDLAAENARLRGELAGVRDTLAALQPPEPEPVAVPVPVDTGPPPEPESTPAPPAAEPSSTGGRASHGAWWS